MSNHQDGKTLHQSCCGLGCVIIPASLAQPLCPSSFPVPLTRRNSVIALLSHDFHQILRREDARRRYRFSHCLSGHAALRRAKLLAQQSIEPRRGLSSSSGGRTKRGDCCSDLAPDPVQHSQIEAPAVTRRSHSTAQLRGHAAHGDDPGEHDGQPGQLAGRGDEHRVSAAGLALLA
ncbi:hypothetical protein B484DRAFT_246109 [Ochromonadaceae sp. CCMP2298]|nr:hypothetical protein B484DRAFT_246109 [Ochromonadaceae sp. CCMP2298]